MAIQADTFLWRPDSGFDPVQLPGGTDGDLVLLFFSSDLVDHWQPPLTQIGEHYAGATVVGCSSAGEIIGMRVPEASIVGVVMRFDATEIRAAMVPIGGRRTAEAADQLVAQLHHADLRYLLVLSDGLGVNGSQLAQTMQTRLSDKVLLTGGLAGDGPRFEQTWVLYDGQLHHEAIVAVGFYGDAIKIAHGSLGGWDPFGPMRTVTRSQDNILYELDNQSALDLYKRYLGSHAEQLPGSGLLFPLSISSEDQTEEVVRTLLAVDEDAKSMTFAGSIPRGSKARLMTANFDRLIDGAHGAAIQTAERLGHDADVALLISCFGRKMVLGDRIEEEVEAVREVLGDQPAIIGFYSYGELSPVAAGGCELHNQTMTITTFAET